MKLLIKTPPNPPHTTAPLGLRLSDLTPRSTVAALQARIEAATGLLHHQQMLLWSGKQLRDREAELGSYGMYENDDGEGGKEGKGKWEGTGKGKSKGKTKYKGRVHAVLCTRAFWPEGGIPFELEICTPTTSFMVETRPRDTMSTLKETIARARGWNAADLDIPFDDSVGMTVEWNQIDEFSPVRVYGKKGTRLFEELGGKEIGVGDGGGDEDEERRGRRRERGEVQVGVVERGGKESDEDESEDEGMRVVGRGQWEREREREEGRKRREGEKKGREESGEDEGMRVVGRAQWERERLERRKRDDGEEK